MLVAFAHTQNPLLLIFVCALKRNKGFFRAADFFSLRVIILYFSGSAFAYVFRPAAEI